jgi:hypothetical protein
VGLTTPVDQKFSAASSALGYLHQCRYALYLLLDRSQTDPNAQVAVERFDDISFEKHGTPEELIQVKHHLGQPPDLKDTSGDIWTTLRAWSYAVNKGFVALPDTIFTIITTATCAPDSAAYFLKDHDSRDVPKAHALLLGASKKMKGATLKPAREEFLALGQQQQRSLLEATHVIDRSPTITDVAARIRKVVGFPVSNTRLPAFVERLEGWWFNQIIQRLAGQKPSPISAVELGLQMDDLRASFSADSLTIDFGDANPPPSTSPDKRVFVAQLELIKLDSKNINHAKVDFFRAFSQRSKWLTDDMVSLTQLDAYDRRLTDEWERERDWINREAKSDEPDDEVVRRGVGLYRHFQTRCSPIRSNCTEPYVGRGSYHMLADRKVVGWHSDFLNRLAGPSASTTQEGESDGTVA